MQTISEFIAQHGITLSNRQIDARSDREMNEWDARASHWRCTLRYQKRGMTVTYSMGSAHHGEPAITDVLDCIASDVSSLINAGDFEEWAGEYGYDTDSRRALSMYKAIEKQKVQLTHLLSDDALLNQLLWETERE